MIIIGLNALGRSTWQYFKCQCRISSRYLTNVLSLSIPDTSAWHPPISRVSNTLRLKMIVLLHSISEAAAKWFLYWHILYYYYKHTCHYLDGSPTNVHPWREIRDYLIAFPTVDAATLCYYVECSSIGASTYWFIFPFGFAPVSMRSQCSDESSLAIVLC